MSTTGARPIGSTEQADQPPDFVMGRSLMVSFEPVVVIDGGMADHSEHAAVRDRADLSRPDGRGTGGGGHLSWLVPRRLATAGLRRSGSRPGAGGRSA